jgi:hypothetical protein
MLLFVHAILLISNLEMMMTAPGELSLGVISRISKGDQRLGRAVTKD